MKLRDVWYGLRQWVPFTLRTIGYGSISCLLGPFTSDHRASLWAMRRWCQASAESLGIDIDVSGLEEVPAEGAFLYACNHQSLVDILVLGAVLPGDMKWAAKRSLMNIPFLGWHLRLAGHVPVDRGVGAGDQVIERFTATLKRGKPLLVFPEGTRSEDGSLQSFKDGAFRAATAAGAPVVPVALDGTGQMMRKGARRLRRNDRITVTVRLGTPIPSAGLDVTDLREATHTAIGELLAG